MERDRFGAPGRDLCTDFRRLRLANFLAFWGQLSQPQTAQTHLAEDPDLLTVLTCHPLLRVIAAEPR
jgi:hypothetical protein